MPTDEERRAVAAGLRGLAEATARLPMPDSNLYSLLSGVVFNGADWDIHDRNPNGLFLNRLADLIEPEERTCRVVTEVRALSLTQDMHTKSCSACGYVFGSEVHTQLLPGLGERVAVDPVVIPNYCPNCGARVIQE